MTIPSKSKVELYNDLLDEAIYNKVTPQALRVAAELAIHELVRDKIKLVESNKTLTAIALEIEHEREEIEQLLYKAAAVVVSHAAGEPPVEAEVQKWIAELRRWLVEEKS